MVTGRGPVVGDNYCLMAIKFVLQGEKNYRDGRLWWLYNDVNVDGATELHTYNQLEWEMLDRFLTVN